MTIFHPCFYNKISRINKKPTFLESVFRVALAVPTGVETAKRNYFSNWR